MVAWTFLVLYRDFMMWQAPSDAKQLAAFIGIIVVAAIIYAVARKRL
jgi:hypothetical protein